MVAHIVLGLPGLGNTFLQVLVLQALHGQRIVLLLQGNQLLLLQHQSGHHIVHQRRRHRRRKPQPPPEGIEGHGQKGQEVRQRINADLQHPIQRRHQSTPSFRSRSKRKAEYASCTSRNLQRLMGRRVPSFSRNTSSCRPATSWKFTATPRQMPQKHG